VKSTSKHNSLTIGIVALVNPPVINGLSQYIIHLYNSLKQVSSSHSIKLITNREFYSFFSNHIDSRDVLLVDIPHHPRWLMRPIYFLWQNFICDKFCKKNAIDLIHIPNAVPLFNNSKIPTIVTIHDMAEFRGFRHSFWHNELRKYITSTSILNAHHLFTVSKFSKSEIIEITGVSKDKITVTYPGNPLQVKKKDLAIENKVKKEIIYFAKGGSNKNFNNVIKAFKKFNTSDKYKLNIITDNKNLATDKNLVCHVEINEDMLKKLYSNSIVLLYPSLYEGFGLPIIEAMSLGVPVITSNRMSMAEVARDAAILVNPNEIDEISDAIGQIINDTELRHSLINKGFERAKRFSWKKTAESTLSMYESVYKSFYNVETL
jgi:glycosyltransferase involved in cell wall biosynthesis